jgi:hypothetical protein
MTVETKTLPDRIRPGQIWYEPETGRHVKILEEEVHGTGPSWTYCTPSGEPEPDGPRHPEWFWHYCDLFDFVVWDRFRFVREGEE